MVFHMRCLCILMILFVGAGRCQFIIQPSNQAQLISSNEAVLAGIPLQGGSTGVQSIGIPNPVGVVPHVSVAVIGQSCVDSFTCSGIPNSHCSINKTCQCLPNFIEDQVFAGTCRLAPGYNEHCDKEDLQCRTPFVCNKSSLCDCPEGFLQEYFQCIKDCPKGEIPIGESCYPARQLEEKCDKNEQCVQTYAQCLHNKCQCIQGANQIKGECVPVSQCPIGDPLKDASNSVNKCNVEEVGSTTCPADYYCLQADASDPIGFCCPKIKMNCPIGQPLEGHNCTTCPWETHHCFSYVIGRFTDTMCCPNACPTSHPIQKDGKCFARSAFEGHCEVDDQCYNVLNAVCRKDSKDENRCLCPKGNYKFYFGRCVRESDLGDQCDVNEDCKIGSGTQCIKNICACIDGQIPEPVKNPKTEVPQKCIGEPTCPSSRGREKRHYFTDCTFDSNVCKESETCKNWWVSGNLTYSLCCKKPSHEDYDALCSQYNMKVALNGQELRRCDILPFTQNFFLNDAIRRNDGPETCAIGSSCLFDPFEVNKGICCEPNLGAPSSANPSTPSSTNPSAHLSTQQTTKEANSTTAEETTTIINSSTHQSTTTSAADKRDTFAVEKPVKSIPTHNLRHNNPIRVITADNINRIPNKHNNI